MLADGTTVEHVAPENPVRNGLILCCATGCERQPWVYGMSRSARCDFRYPPGAASSECLMVL
jgi:hypothetical protein